LNIDSIITDNLKIRRFTIDDVSAYFINNNEAQLKEFMPNHYVEDVTEAHTEVESYISNYSKSEIEYHYAVTKDDILIGHVGIGETNVNDNINIYEICCAINKNYRGLGYATEATKAFVAWCKKTFALEKIYASTDHENISSNKVLLNAGFVLTDIKIKELSVYVI
jgi:RimJ/RimL family protein N-acetyltransferase